MKVAVILPLIFALTQSALADCPTAAEIMLGAYNAENVEAFAQTYSRECQQLTESPVCQNVYQKVEDAGNKLADFKPDCSPKKYVYDPTGEIAASEGNFGCMVGVFDAVIGDSVKGVWHFGENAYKNYQAEKICNNDIGLKKALFTDYNAKVDDQFKIDVPNDRRLNAYSCSDLKIAVKEAGRLKIARYNYALNQGKGPQKSDLIKKAKAMLKDFGVQLNCYSLKKSAEILCRTVSYVALIASPVLIKNKIAVISGIAKLSQGEKISEGALAAKAVAAETTVAANEISSAGETSVAVAKLLAKQLDRTPADQQNALRAVVSNAGSDDLAAARAMKRFADPSRGLIDLDHEIASVNSSLGPNELAIYNRYLHSQPLNPAENAQISSIKTSIEKRQQLTTERAILANRDSISVTKIEPNAVINQQQAFARIDSKLNNDKNVGFGIFTCEKSVCSAKNLDEYKRIYSAYRGDLPLPPSGQAIPRAEVSALLKNQYRAEGKIPDVTNPAPESGYSVTAEIKEGQSVGIVKITSAAETQKRPTSFIGEYAVVDVNGPGAYQRASFSQNVTGTSIDGELTFYKAQVTRAKGDPPIEIQINAIGDSNYGKAATGGSTQYIVSAPARNIRFERVSEVVQTPRAEGPLGQKFLSSVKDIRSSDPNSIASAQQKLGDISQDLNRRWAMVSARSINQLETEHRDLAIDTSDNAAVKKMLKERTSTSTPCVGQVRDAFQCDRLTRMRAIQETAGSPAKPQLVPQARAQIEAQSQDLRRKMSKIEGQFETATPAQKQSLYEQYSQLRRNLNNLREDIEDLSRLAK